jgi:hypothetical protein
MGNSTITRNYGDAMEQIKAWKTTDGKLFEAKDDAGSHQYELDTKAKLEKFVQHYYSYNLTTSELELILWEGRFELMEIFKP